MILNNLSGKSNLAFGIFWDFLYTSTHPKKRQFSKAAFVLRPRDVVHHQTETSYKSIYNIQKLDAVIKQTSKPDFTS